MRVGRKIKERKKGKLYWKVRAHKKELMVSLVSSREDHDGKVGQGRQEEQMYRKVTKGQKEAYEIFKDHGLNEKSGDGKVKARVKCRPGWEGRSRGGEKSKR